MKLTKREQDYILCLDESFHISPRITKSMRQVMRLRGKGLTYSEIDKKRGKKGSRQLDNMAKMYISGIVETAKRPLLGFHCAALNR